MEEAASLAEAVLTEGESDEDEVAADFRRDLVIGTSGTSSSANDTRFLGVFWSFVGVFLSFVGVLFTFVGSALRGWVDVVAVFVFTPVSIESIAGESDRSVDTLSFANADFSAQSTAVVDDSLFL